MKKPAPRVQKYAGCILVARPEGVDVCDPTTNRWCLFPTMRSARWSATVFTRLASKFGHDVADERLLEATLNQHTKD